MNHQLELIIHEKWFMTRFQNIQVPDILLLLKLRVDFINMID